MADEQNVTHINITRQDRKKTVTKVHYKNAKTARRYASALYDLATEDNALTQALAEIKALQTILEKSEELLETLTSPVTDRNEKTAAIVAVCQSAGASDLLLNFLRVVGKHNRLMMLQDIVVAFEARVAEARGEVTAHVTAPRPLTDAQKKDLKATLEKKTSKKIKLDIEVEPELLAGLVVRVGSKMYDASLKAKLSDLQRNMKRPAGTSSGASA